MALFHEKDTQKEIAQYECEFCHNKFKGRDSAHSKDLYINHKKRKHPDGKTELVY